MEPRYDINDIIALYWIRSNGLLHYSWYVRDVDARRLHEEEIFLAGFMQAISSIGYVIFEKTKLQQIRFQGYGIHMADLPSRDRFLLIVRENIPDSVVIALLERLTRAFSAPLPNTYEERDSKDPMQSNITRKWLEILSEHGFTSHAVPQKPSIKAGSVVLSGLPDNDSFVSLEIPGKEVDSDQNPKSNQKINQLLQRKLESFALIGKMMGHSLNNVLVGILGNINLTKEELPPNSENYHNLQEAEKMIERAKELATQLMTLANPLQKKDSSEMSTEINPQRIIVDGPNLIGLSKLPYDSNKGASETPRHSGVGRILIMEDDDIVSKVEKKLLEKIGYVVDISKKGEQAIELVKQALTKGLPYKVAILDYMIQGGMGGIDTVKELRKLAPELICIIASGFTEDPIFTYYHNFQFDAAIKKPFDLADLNRLFVQLKK